MPPPNPPRPPGPPGPSDPRRRPPRPGRLEGPPPGPQGPGRLEGPPPSQTPRPPRQGGLEGPPPGQGPPRRPQPPPSEPRRAAASRPTRRPPAAGDAPTTPAAAAPRPPRDPQTAVLENGDSSGRSARRAASRRKSRRRAFIAAALVILLAGGGAAFALSGGGDETNAALSAKRKVAPTTTTTEPQFQNFVTLTSNVDSLKAYEQPDEASPVVGEFSKTTEYKQPRTLLALEAKGDWFQAALPMRPASSSYKDGVPTGWVKASEVIPGSTDYEIHISLSQHTVALLKAGKPVEGFGEPGKGTVGAVVGKDTTPTPLGKFYVTDPVDLQSRPNGAYGAFALGLSGYSEVLKTFNGGPGQIAIHGNGQLNTVGTNISNGCIRLFNDDILKIAKTVPLGTPVIIEA